MKKRIILTEADIINIVKELLNEDIYTSPPNRRAIRYLIRNKGFNDEEAKNLIKKIMDELEIHHSKDPRFKFMLGLSRLYADNQINTEEKIKNIKTVLKYISSGGHINEYDENINNENLDVLYDRFKELQVSDTQKSRENVNSKVYKNRGYNIVKIKTKKQCEKYGEYTDWCITRGSFNSYNLNTYNQCYFCLKPGFEKIELPNSTENAPFDEYGLSMISVIVDSDGNPKYITTRYNHKFNGENNPNLRTAEQVSDLVGVNFYNTFKPNTYWEDKIKKVNRRLANGENIDDVFDEVKDIGEGFKSCKLDGKYLILRNDNTFATYNGNPMIFDRVGDFYV